MNEDERLSPLEDEMLAGLSAFRDALKAGVPIEERFTVRTITLDLDTHKYQASDVKKFRRSLNASQSLLAKFLGVSVKSIRAWEQGLRPVPDIACRFMDEVHLNPTVWTNRVRESKSRC